MGKNAVMGLIVLFGLFSLGATADTNKTDDSRFDQSKNIGDMAQKPTLSQTDLKKSPLGVTPDQQLEDADKIHEELKQIIARTQQLQKQVGSDRNEIRLILERAQIHEQILKNIKIPKPIQSKQQINRDDIIAREKMRLIAVQAHQTQEHLKALQSSRLIHSIPKTESQTS